MRHIRLIAVFAVTAALAFTCTCCGESNKGKPSPTGTGTSTSTGTGTGTATTAYEIDLYDMGDAYSGFSPSGVEPGDDFSVWCRVGNQGSDPSGRFLVDFYLSMDKVITEADYYLGQVEITDIAGGAFDDIQLDCQIAPEIPDGYYYVGWVIDPAGAVAETDETNNTAYKTGSMLEINSSGEYRVTCYPRSSAYWTGSVTLSNKYDELVTVTYGATTLYGFIKFDISSIPETASITKVEIHVYVSAVRRAFNTMRFYQIKVDPVTASGRDICYDRTFYLTSLPVSSTGWVTINLVSAGCSALQNVLSTGFYAITLYSC
jgi:hypothetical protein